MVKRELITTFFTLNHTRLTNFFFQIAHESTNYLNIILLKIIRFGNNILGQTQSPKAEYVLMRIAHCAYVRAFNKF